MRIEDKLFDDVKTFAAQHHRSLNSVIEDALRQLLSSARQAERRPRVELPVFSGKPGLRPGVEPTPRYIKELLHAEDIERYLEV